MDKIWKRITDWLAKNAPLILKDLRPPANEESISRAEKQMKVQLPSDLKDSLMIHDGQLGMAANLLGQWQLLSTEDILNQWKINTDLLKDNVFEGSLAEPIGPVKSDWWNKKWLPVAYDGAGNLCCVDLDAPVDGVNGQVIIFWHDQPKRPRIAQGFREWIKTFADDLEQNKYEFVGNQLKYMK